MVLYYRTRLFARNEWLRIRVSEKTTRRRNVKPYVLYVYIKAVDKLATLHKHSHLVVASATTYPIKEHSLGATRKNQTYDVT